MYVTFMHEWYFYKCLMKALRYFLFNRIKNVHKWRVFPEKWCQITWFHARSHDSCARTSQKCTIAHVCWVLTHMLSLYMINKGKCDHLKKALRFVTLRALRLLFVTQSQRPHEPLAHLFEGLPGLNLPHFEGPATGDRLQPLCLGGWGGCAAMMLRTREIAHVCWVSPESLSSLRFCEIWHVCWVREILSYSSALFATFDRSDMFVEFLIFYDFTIFLKGWETMMAHLVLWLRSDWLTDKTASEAPAG